MHRPGAIMGTKRLFAVEDDLTFLGVSAITGEVPVCNIGGVAHWWRPPRQMPPRGRWRALRSRAGLRLPCIHTSTMRRGHAFSAPALLEWRGQELPASAGRKSWSLRCDSRRASRCRERSSCAAHGAPAPASGACSVLVCWDASQDDLRYNVACPPLLTAATAVRAAFVATCCGRSV